MCIQQCTENSDGDYYDYMGLFELFKYIYFKDTAITVC